MSSASRNNLKNVRKEAEKCLASGDHIGAFVQLSHALKQAEAIQATDHEASSAISQILAQRSKCLLKMSNHYFSLEDARRLVSLEPNSAVGHQRLAEVYHSTCHFVQAHDSYLRCFQLSSKKEQDFFMEQMKVCKREIAKERAIDEKYPWVGAGVGIVVSIAAVVADQVLLQGDAYIIHPLFKVFIVMAVSITCYYFASKYRGYMVRSRDSLLEKPVDLLQDFEGDKKRD